MYIQIILLMLPFVFLVICSNVLCYENGKLNGLETIKEICEEFDLECETHGEWIVRENTAECSNCHQIVSFDDNDDASDYQDEVNYCFNCGARMDR